jgi:peptide/nickel transport system ATP-binding protein
MVELIAQRVLVMYLGKVVESAPAARLSEHPAHPYSRLLWSALESSAAHDRVESWEVAEQERPRSGCRFRTRCPIYRARGEPEICRDAASEPALREIAPDHAVACHFVDA